MEKKSIFVERKFNKNFAKMDEILVKMHPALVVFRYLSNPISLPKYF